MPIANVSAILQALPLAVSLAATLFLGEALGWRRFAAIATGFVGVVFIIQPGGADFSSYSLYALIAVACITLRDLAVRRMSVRVNAVFVALIAARLNWLMNHSSDKGAAGATVFFILWREILNGRVPRSAAPPPCH
jgi:drug/metabolite transporter (DMT)-like permease